MKINDFFDFTKCFEDFPYLKTFYYENDDGESTGRFSWQHKLFFLSFGAIYLWNKQSQAFTREVHLEYAYVFFSVDFTQKPGKLRMLPKGFSGTFPPFIFNEMPKHKVHIDKINKVCKAIGLFANVTDEKCQELKSYYRSADTKPAPTKSPDLIPYDSESYIRRLEIKHAIREYHNGKKIIIPPKLKHTKDQCKGNKAKSGEKNIRIS